MRRLLTTLFSLLLLPVLAPFAGATWSIVVLDRSTGEVCCATATCIAGWDIKLGVPIIVVGRGAAATQSVVPQIPKRKLIRDGLLYGGDPQRILDAVIAIDNTPETRQYGIVSFAGPPVTYTGAQAGAAAPSLVGIHGTLEYAIQGNVLTGDVVATAAEAALIATEGDLATRVMAAMEAARAMGGDGRCSCTPSNPTGCGAPPPSFTKSAHTACIALARPGDLDGVCTVNLGCANGQYYLCETVQGGGAAPDPVITLQRKVDQWRANLAGVTDHVLTEVRRDTERLVADGRSQARVRVRLVDVDGHALAVGGQTLTITELGGTSLVGIGAASDLGNGEHEFTLTAGQTAGLAQLRVVVQDAGRDVQLYPDLELPIDDLADLHLGRSAIEASRGLDLALTINRPSDANAPYRLLMSASGTVPGTPFGAQHLPLNDDRLLQWTLGAPSPAFPGGQGTLGASGWAQGRLVRTVPLATPFIGGRFDFVAVVGAAPPYFISAPLGLEILP